LTFFGLLEPGAYEQEDFDFYVSFLEKMEETANSTETSIMYQFSRTSKPIISINRAKEVGTKLWESKMFPQFLDTFIEKLDRMNTSDVTVIQASGNQTKTPVGPLEPVLSLILELNVKNRKYIVENLKPIYLAGDINEDHSIGFQEFLILIRHIEGGSYSDIQATEIFYDKCDLIDKDSQEREMTFKNFSLMAFEKGLFSQRTQGEFLGPLASGKSPTIENLKSKWNLEKDDIEKRFAISEKITEFHSEMIQKIETVLNQKLDAQEKSYQIKTACLVLRLLDEDSKRSVLEMHIADIICEDLIFLHSHSFEVVRKSIMLGK
jgi:hypothetical protein